MKKFSVYVITCLPTGKQYVGCTCNTIHVRLRQHIRAAYGQGGLKDCCRVLSAAIRQYGEGNFTVELLRETLCREKSLMLEAQMAISLGTMAPEGLNLSAGNHQVMSAEAKSRFRDATANNGQDHSVMKEGLARFWADPRRKQLRGERAGASLKANKQHGNRMRALVKDEQWKKGQSERSTSSWKKPEVRARRSAGLKASWTPERRAAHRERVKAQWAARKELH